MTARRVAAACGLALVALVAGVVLLWPRPSSGPQPIQYGVDACAGCRMPLTRPGFAGEMRDANGTLTKYDDVGCLLRAMLAARREIPEAWVEAHDGGDFVPLLQAHLVRLDASETPMGSGILAFKDEDAAKAHARERAGRVLRLEDALHGPDVVARIPNPPDARTEVLP